MLELRERARFGVAAQTTQPIEKVRKLVGLIRRRFPQFGGAFHRHGLPPHQAAPALRHRAGAAGGGGSGDRRRAQQQHAGVGQDLQPLLRARASCAGGDDLREEWFEGAQTVGVTAGTSTPDAPLMRSSNG